MDHPYPQTAPKVPKPKLARRYTVPKEITNVLIPSIDEFRLSHILSNELANESEQVTESLLQVVSNYQQDLRNEVKRKITIEQKIQYKNISIAKLTFNLHKSLEQKNKKLSKLYALKPSATTDSNGHQSQTTEAPSINMLDREVGEVLDYSVRSTRKVRNLAQRLLELDKKLSAPSYLKVQKYPKTFRLLELEDLIQTPTHSCPSSPSSDILKGDSISDVHIDPLLVTQSNCSENEEMPSSSVENEAPRQAAKSIEDSVAMIESEADPIYKSTSDLDDKIHSDQNGEESMDQQKFEQFMSNSIQKYRQLQEDKYGNSDMFDNLLLPSSPVKESSDMSSLNSGSKFPYHNPLNLLYSNLILRSQLDKPSTVETATSLIYSPTLNIKLSATVKQSLSNSHFKKLRINGNPITSATFKNMKHKPKCACDDHELHVETDSPLKSNLPNIHNLDISTDFEDEDLTYSSSALNSDENESDLLLSSSEDDSDEGERSVNTSENFLSRMTNDYYISLQRKLKRRRRSQKRAVSKVPIIRDDSPTPKHKPSHRTLKPKRSILKSSTTGGPKKLVFLENTTSKDAPNTVIGAVSENIEPVASQEKSSNTSTKIDSEIHWSSFEQMNKTKPKKSPYGISHVIVLGTIIASPELDNQMPDDHIKEIDEESSNVQAISNLRVLLQQNAH